MTLRRSNRAVRSAVLLRLMMAGEDNQCAVRSRREECRKVSSRQYAAHSRREECHKAQTDSQCVVRSRREECRKAQTDSQCAVRSLTEK